MEKKFEKERRSNVERRVFSYSSYLPERRKTKDRRKSTAESEIPEFEDNSGMRDPICEESEMKM